MFDTIVVQQKKDCAKEKAGHYRAPYATQSHVLPELFVLPYVSTQPSTNVLIWKMYAKLARVFYVISKIINHICL